MKKRILVDLDTLLDTRLATIARLDPEIAAEVISNPEYFSRDYDDWTFLTKGKITTEQFKKAYAERGGENTAATINAAFESGMSPLLLRIFSEHSLLERDGMIADGDSAALSVNVYPYVIDFETEELLIQIMRERYGPELDVEIVNDSLESLTPEIIKACFAAYISYHFWDWLPMHYAALHMTKIPFINVIGPILFEKDPKDLTAQEREREFTTMRLINTEYIDIQYVSCKYFSIFRT